MQIINTPQGMQQNYSQGKTIALVPTMGNLHAGHLSLVDQVKPLVDKVIVSIFVNPTQFGPNEDFASYPRTFDQDCALLSARGVDTVFAPQAQDMYPENIQAGTFIKVPGLSDILCGASRPGHFQGVATIVFKLFQIVRPNIAIFGEKDYQQLSVIRRMVADLYLPITVLGAPIVREANGLAMSSRNQYLSAEQRSQAALLYSELKKLVEEAKHSDDYETLVRQSTERLTATGFNTDYVAIRRQDDLLEPGARDNKLVALAATFLGKTRLIDNIIFDKPRDNSHDEY
jgi:pantoate--beta-alanine ligase